MGLLKLIRGNSCPELAEAVALALDGTELSKATVTKFLNGETSVSVNTSVREADVFIIQSGSGEVNANDAVMELLILINACRTASARRVIGVVPYFPYAKQNKIKNRGAIPAKLMASMIKVAGATQLITLDLSPAQMTGFFDIPIDNMNVWPLITQYIMNHVADYKRAVVVAKNAGASKRATTVAKELKLDVAMVLGDLAEDDDDVVGAPPPSPSRVSLHSTGDDEDVAQASEEGATDLRETPYRSGGVIGHVRGRTCIIIDDVIDSASKFISAANALAAMGSSRIVVIATHGILSGSAPEDLDASAIDEIVVTNSISQDRALTRCTKLKVMRCESVLAEAVRRVHNDECMSSEWSTKLEMA
eukprot:m.432569 g.432569  ORF g.432569 m.432569 type:complete len:362 (-) comp21410_c0_seq3:1908-2993(-)